MTSSSISVFLPTNVSYTVKSTKLPSNNQTQAQVWCKSANSQNPFQGSNSPVHQQKSQHKGIKLGETDVSTLVIARASNFGCHLTHTLCGAPPLGLVQLRASETPSHVPRHGPLVNAAWMSSDSFLVLPLTQDQCAYRDPTRGKLPLKTELLVSFGTISLHHDKVEIRGGTLHQVVPELSLNMSMS